MTITRYYRHNVQAERRVCFINSLIMVALWNRADHYIFALLLVSFFFLLSLFLSLPDLSGRKLDVYHTSTHDVALV